MLVLTKDPIIITQDCLKDYHELMQQGFEVIAKPDYTEQGLAASFCDQQGIRFTVLEKRSYREE